MLNLEIPFHANGFVVDEPEDIRRLIGGKAIQHESMAPPLSPISQPSRMKLQREALKAIFTRFSKSGPSITKFPLEIRKRIYKHAVVRERGIEVTVYYPDPLVVGPKHCNPDIVPSEPAIAFTNRQVRDEVLAVYYSENSFKLSSIKDAQSWLHSIRHVNAVVRDVRLSLPDQHPFNFGAATPNARIHVSLEEDSNELSFATSRCTLMVICTDCQEDMLEFVTQINDIYANLRSGRRVDDKLRMFVAWMNRLCPSGADSPFERIAEMQEKGWMEMTMEGKMMCRLCRWAV